MIVNGIGKNAYYVLNPILVECEGVSGKVDLELTLAGRTFKFKFNNYNGTVAFDLAQIVRGIIPNVKNKIRIEDLKDANQQSTTVDGCYKITMNIRDAISNYTFVKYYILGGSLDLDWNKPVPRNLSLTNYYWEGFPNWMSIFADGEIKNVNLSVNSNLLRLKPRVNCNNAFLVFRNDKGGFSYYLFEDFNISESSKDLGYYVNRRNVKDSGTETTPSLHVRGKIKREFYETISHLSRSAEIYLYKETENKYQRLVGANEVNFNQKNQSEIVELSFKIVNNFVKTW